MQLSKQLPARRKTLQFEWCKSDFMEMSPQFRDIRSRLRDAMDACGWCGHKFADGEMMALAHPKGKKNTTLCQRCAAELLDSQTEEKK